MRTHNHARTTLYARTQDTHAHTGLSVVTLRRYAIGPVSFDKLALLDEGEWAPVPPVVVNQLWESMGGRKEVSQGLGSGLGETECGGRAGRLM